MGRIVLFLIGIWWRKITKVFFYYELITSGIEFMLPFDINLATATLIRVLVTLVNFQSDYFHFWPSLVCILLQFPFMAIMNAEFNNLPRDQGFYSKIVSDMIVQAVLIWICHLFITKAGMIFVEVEVLRDGNEQLLNNLEEGLII